jgi:hypothetical protein
VNPVLPALVLLGAGSGPVAPSYEGQIRPLLERYCYDCHGQGSARGDVALDGYASAEARRRDQALWSRVWENVRNDLMPPRGQPRPTAAERAALGAWIRGDVQEVDCRAPAPGKVTIRRLNRDEYNRSVADLFGIDLRPADDFPPDDSGYGFDNIGDVLSVSPVLTEKYFNAAEQVVSKVVAARPEVPRRAVRREDLRAVAEPAPQVTLREGRLSLDHAGTHLVEVKLAVNSFRPFFGKARVRVELDGHRLVKATYLAGNRPYRYRRRLQLGKGEHTVRFALDLSGATANAGRAINIALEELSVTGPVGTRVREYPPAHRRLFFRGPAPRDPVEREAYAREILESVAGRAFRRPVDPPTLDRLTTLALTAAEQSGRFETGIAQALQAILTSPRFLFRVETPPAGQSAAAGFALDDHALATRLSYFLLGGPPDEGLRALAARGELRSNLREEVGRLVRDRRSDRFVERFVGQWLQTRDLPTVTIAPDKFRALSQGLRGLMRDETELLFAHILRENRDAIELVTASYTFLNADLARHYGLPEVDGPQMRRVELPPDSVRGGILGQGSFLTVTSNPTRTSPVKRGVFVLDNLLGAPPPPPPPNVPNLEDAGKGAAGPLSLREQLGAHRANPACAGCHARMDPIGLALENFDPIGRWRDDDDGQAIDPRGKLTTGEEIAGVRALRAVLGGRREIFYRTLTRKLMVFALGRGLQAADECTVDTIVAAMLADGGRLTTLLVGLVESPAFLMNRGEDG